MKNRRLFIAVILIVSILAAIFFFGPFATSIETVHPVRGPAVQGVYATGTVEPTVMMPIAPRVTGRLVELKVDEGSDVRADEILARLEDEDLSQALKELQATERFASTEYKRASELIERNAIARSEYEKLRSNWDAAKAAVARKSAELDYMKLVAPADGRVIRRDGEVGQLIPANQTLFWISCCAPLRISAEVDEEDIALVKPGQKVLIRADAFPGEVFNGEVKSITPKGDPIARSYRVRIAILGETPLLIGMTAEANIIAREASDALLVPSSAVASDKVWVVRDGVLRRPDVKIGAKGSEKTEIISGISENDLVVVMPEPDMNEGQRVRTRIISQGN